MKASIFAVLASGLAAVQAQGITFGNPTGSFTFLDPPFATTAPNPTFATSTTFATVTATRLPPSSNPVVPAAINTCGNNCINDMFRKAVDVMGCTQFNVRCYCSQQNVYFGMRDCSGQACGSDQQRLVLDWWDGVCAQNRV